MSNFNRRQFLQAAGAATAWAALPRTVGAATTSGRVVVVGGGFGGATVAKYLRLWGGDVEVTLVDNRGSALPEPVRRAALRHLEEVVSGSISGRIVARTAPEGSDDAVTILSSVPGGGTTLTTIDDQGGIKVKVP